MINILSCVNKKWSTLTFTVNLSINRVSCKIDIDFNLSVLVIDKHFMLRKK